MTIIDVITTLIILIIVNSQANNYNYSDHGANWPGCSLNFTQQSPIILNTNTTSMNNQSYLFTDFKSTQSLVSILNTTIYIKPNNSNDVFGVVYTLTIDSNSTPFKATQMRIRVHSEHRIGDKDGYYDLQLQIFHRQLTQSNRNYKFALSLLFESTNETQQNNTFLTKIQQIDKTTNITELDLSEFLERYNTFNYWFYQGSPTIPPCSDRKIYWLVVNKIYKMSLKQKQYFNSLFYKKDIIDGNWRDIQQINQNPIGYYKFPKIDIS